VDRRDGLTWIILELTHLGEAKVDDGTLESSLRSDLDVGPDFPIFIPAATYRKDIKVCAVTLLEGYAFAATGLSDVAYYRLEKKPYISQVMSTFSGPHKIRTLTTLPDEKITELKLQLRQKVSSDIKLGNWVKVVSGTHKSLEGEVTGIEDDCAFVRIELRSLKLIATIPVVFLEETLRPDGGVGIE